MIRMMLMAAACATCLSACVIKIGGASVERGATKGNLRSIDGNLRIGDRATVKSARAIDGNVVVGDGAQVGSIGVIDGGVRGGNDLVVRKDIEVIDGEIRLDTGTRVGGSVRLIDGEAWLTGTSIVGDLELTCASGDLHATTVSGRLTMREMLPDSDDDCHNTLMLNIGPDSVIHELAVESHIDVVIDPTASVTRVALDVD